jgi:hypothetical protein
MIHYRTLLLLLCLPLQLFSFTVDLREPIYEDGVLKTDKGGVISGPNLRIQATQIHYTRKGDVEQIEAEGDVMVEVSGYIFVGKRIEYDLISGSGILHDGRTGVEPWFFGGTEIHLLSDGNYRIVEGFATTSENYDTEWEVISKEALLEEQKYLKARNVYFQFLKLPLFWLPILRLNLDTIFDNPIRYYVYFGGSQGPRMGMAYEVFSWKKWKTFVLLDYRTRRGLGGGFETNYVSEDGNHELDTVNYIANDITLYNAHPRTRYRYQGVYSGCFDYGNTTVDLSWDKLSDKDMATDYHDNGLELDIAKRTQLLIRREERNWIMNLLASVRINDFQTLKQELPTLAGNFRPFEIWNTGIISDNNFKLSYLELEYNDGTDNHDYNSPRYELNYNFYRPFHYSNVNFTPETGGVSIYYGNSPEKRKVWMNIGYLGADINTNFYRFYGSCKHVVTPYINYRYYSYPSTSPKDHYIFDIDDGWAHLDIMRVGFDQSFYAKLSEGCIYRKFYFDIWTNLFFDTPTIESTAPILYAKMIQNLTPRMRYTLATGWDFRDNVLDHFNTLLEWTISPNVAIATEFRYRSEFCWRKVDHNNFMLDSYETVQELEDSSLSDRRNTILLNYYYRFHPSWAVHISSRHGWNRVREPAYNEFEIDLLGTIRSTWHVKFYYRHREDEDRFSVNFSVGLKAPCRKDYDSFVPCLEF